RTEERVVPRGRAGVDAGVSSPHELAREPDGAALAKEIGLDPQRLTDVDEEPVAIHLGDAQLAPSEDPRVAERHRAEAEVPSNQRGFDRPPAARQDPRLVPLDVDLEEIDPR